MQNLTFQSADSEEDFYQSALDDVVFAIKETLKEKEECRLGLAGGSTPKKLYEALAQAKLPWERIRIILIDERYVPSDDPESNLRMLRNSLLKHIPLPPENLTVFDTSLKPESAAKDMSRKMIALSHKRFPIIDLLVLGAGTDGHIASLFEGDSAMTCSYYACQAQAEDYKTKSRLTLSLIALKNSQKALLLLLGQNKEPVLKALQGEASSLKLTALKSLAKKMTLKVLYHI